MQWGSGSVRPLVLVYHVGDAVDAAIKEAVGPSALIANTTVTGSEYQDTPPLEEIERKLSEAANATFYPVIVAGFSAGGFATRRILQQGGLPDAVVVADGTYASTPAGWSDWKKYADRARFGEGIFIASHTSLVIPSATWRVLSAISGEMLPLAASAPNRPANVPVLHEPFERRQWGNFIVYSYGFDHSYQGSHVLPMMLHEAMQSFGDRAKKGTLVALGFLGLVAIGAAAIVLLKRR